MIFARKDRFRMKKKFLSVVAVAVLLCLCMGCANGQGKTSYFAPLLAEQDGDSTTVAYEKAEGGLTKVYKETPEGANPLTYHHIEATKENGELFQMVWMKLNDNTLIENVEIDLSAYGSPEGGWMQDGAFYEEASDSVFLTFDAVSAQMGDVTGAVWLLVQMPVGNPSSYQITAFDDAQLKQYGFWFSEACRIGTKIYENQGVNTPMWSVDLETKEIVCLEYVKETAETVAKDVAKEFFAEKAWEEPFAIWYSIGYQMDDVTVYQATVCEEMDLDSIFTLYLAFRGEECVGVMLEDVSSNTLQELELKIK